MPLDPRISTLGEVPSLAPNIAAGFQLGEGIVNAPRRAREAQLKEQQGVRTNNKDIAMSLYAAFGQDSVTPETFGQFQQVAQQMGLPMDGLTLEKANNALGMGKNLIGQQMKVSGRGASSKGFAPQRVSKQTGVDEKGNPIFEDYYQAITYDPASQTWDMQEIKAGAEFTSGGLTSQEQIDVAGAKTGAVEGAKTQAMIERETSLKKERQTIEQQQIELAKQKMDLNQQQTKQAIQDYEAEASLTDAADLLQGNLDSIYGKEERFYPDMLRSQEGLDLMAKRDKFVASIELAQAGKLKGQGQVSEGERAILKAAATELSNPLISPASARAAVSRAMESIKRTMSDEARANIKKPEAKDPNLKSTKGGLQYKVVKP